jgi:L-alanine-DL-glutamate epimerase-like enolase superfamily enzyme
MQVQIDEVLARTAILPLEETRAIAREVSSDAEVVRVDLAGGGHSGQGESCPMPRYGESLASVLAQIEAVRPRLLAGLSRPELTPLMPPGAARNAIDAALWDLDAKQSRISAETMANPRAPQTVTTAYTIPIKPPAEAERVARRESARPLIKVKLGHFDEDRARLEAIRRAAPDAALIVDANEGWSLDQLRIMAPIARDLGVKLIEQPIHASADVALEGVDWGIPLCADESCHTRKDLDAVASRYQYVNIKLDKTGGLTEALALVTAARARGLGLMVGSTSGTTLGIAPAFLVAQFCDFCDLDAPLFLAEREERELAYDGSTLSWSSSRRWGRA